MQLLWWLVATGCLVFSAADEALDLEGLLDGDETVNEPEYSVHVGKWTECLPNNDFVNSVKRLDTSLVYYPKLGLQRRQVQCRHKDGRFVEAMYCGSASENIGTTKVCVVKEDCVLGEWLPWRPRSDGSLVRTRRVLRLPQGGGKECDVVEEVRPTSLEATAHWVPGPWGACKVSVTNKWWPVVDKPDSDDDAVDDIYEDDDEAPIDYADDRNSTSNCGGGTQRREASCVRSDGRALHATQCAHAPMPKLVQPCEVPCPRDCEVGEWSEWSPCQPTDGCPLYPVQQLTTIGFSIRKRRVKTAASRGGSPCPPLEEKRSCSAPRCASWKPLPWGPCVLVQTHSLCGPGRRTRELRCIGHDGKEAQRAWCVSSGAPARTERCRIACAGDCVVSAWGRWGACSATCAAPGRPAPLRRRVRHILAHASPKGWPCPTPEQLIQQETCNTHACPTYSWLATPWGPCERRTEDFMPSSNYTDFLDGDTFAENDDEEPCIEEGEMTREVMCVQNNADVVREALCVPLHRPESRRACTVRCKRGCRVEAWSPWSSCPNNCEDAKQYRSRIVHGGPNCGAQQESRTCVLPRSCRLTVSGTTAAAPGWVTGRWGACRVTGVRCGAGLRTRSVWCGSDSHRIEAGSCAGLPVPVTVASCFVNCNHEEPINCATVCADPLTYLDSADPHLPDCVCRNVSLELLPADSDCILSSGSECGEGRLLRAARCIVGGKDVPMDVCKKYHPLTGQRRVREASTDGLSYDTEFPELLSGSCTVVCSRDCAVGPWGEWGPCAAEAGSLAAFRFRTREVIVEGSASGRECGATLQRSTCSLSAPRWVTGEWSVCAPRNSLCGRAIINRTVSCVDSEGKRLDDESCDSSGPKPAEEAACRAPCPGDCVISSWSEWSPCEQSKWGGRRDRTRSVLRPAAAGGTPCASLVTAEPCAPRAHSWHIAPWDDCQPLGGSPCGEGVKKRSVRCLRSDGVFVNDTFCPNATAPEPRESWCYVPCGVDCELSEWSEWDSSACACGDFNHGHMRRTRQQLTAAEWPGRACGQKEQRAPCPRTPCMNLVSRPLIGCQIQKSQGGEAENTCGWGVRVSIARCELSASVGATLAPWRCASVLPGRIVIPPDYHQEEPCEVECGCKDSSSVGQIDSWAPWGPCREGARSRTRQLLVPPRTACKTSSRFVTIEWANCTDDDEDIPDLIAIEPREEKPRRAWIDHEVYHDGYIEGSSSLLAVVWTATLVLSFYGAFILYRGIISCLRSRRLKSVTKV